MAKAAAPYLHPKLQSIRAVDQGRVLDHRAAGAGPGQDRDDGAGV